jgi:hypothetical protein
MVYMMKNKPLDENEDFTRTVVFPAVTPISKYQNIPLSILEKKIAKLEYEAAIRMALDTFLDCSADKVKVSNRIPKSPRSTRMMKV